MNYRQVNDPTEVHMIKEALKRNGGYCPSIIDSYNNELYKCPCKEFINECKKGETCRCGLYIKTK